MFSSALTAVVRILGFVLRLARGTVPAKWKVFHFHRSLPARPQSRAPQSARESSLFFMVYFLSLLFYANTDDLPGLHRENGVGQAVGAVHIMGDKQKSAVKFPMILFQDTHDGISGDQIQTAEHLIQNEVTWAGSTWPAPGESLRCSPPDSCRAGISNSRSSIWVSSMSSPTLAALPL